MLKAAREAVTKSHRPLDVNTYSDGCMRLLTFTSLTVYLFAIGLYFVLRETIGQTIPGAAFQDPSIAEGMDYVDDYDASFMPASLDHSFFPPDLFSINFLVDGQGCSPLNTNITMKSFTQVATDGYTRRSLTATLN